MIMINLSIHLCIMKIIFGYKDIQNFTLYITKAAVGKKTYVKNYA